MRYSVYCMATDLMDEGVGHVLDNLVERAGVDGITVAVKYHAARDIYPHNPRRKVASVSPGAYYQSRYHSQPSPHGSPLAVSLSPLAAQRDLLAELCQAGGARQVGVGAWAVMLHDDEVAPDHACLQVNCWGDRLAGALCPAQPEVKEHACSVVEELAGYPVSAVRVESLHYHGISHGHHHERYLETYGAMTRWLLGLCFCEHCLGAAGQIGVDGRSLGRQVRHWVEESFSYSRTEPELSREALTEAFGDEMAGYLRVRQEVVTSLVTAAAGAAGRQGVRLSFIDATLAGRSYSDGVASGPLASQCGWENGIDLPRLAAGGADIETTAYVADPGRFAEEVTGYRNAIPTSAQLGLILRPGRPDCEEAGQLAVKTEMASKLGCAEVNFYNYGLYRLDALDRIRLAVEAGA